MRKTTFFCEMWDLNFTLWIVFSWTVCEKTTCPGFFFAKILLPQECVCENLGESGPWYAKDLGQVFLKRCSMFVCHIKNIHNVCICDVAILYMMTGNHLFFFLRKTCFLKNAGHKSLRLIAKWQLDNIYVEPLVCEELGPGSSQTTACSLALLCASLWFA